MDLIYFKIKDYKKLNIEFNVDGHSVMITGKNEVGKSSVIDAIQSTLGIMGKVEIPIQKGKRKAENIAHYTLLKDYTHEGVTLTKGMVLVCERTFTPTSTKMTIHPEGGMPIPSPMTFLKTLLGIASLPDPSALVNMKPMEQKKFLETFLGVDTSDIMKRKRETLDEITATEDLIKTTRGAIAELIDIPEKKLERRELTEIEEEQKELQKKIQDKAKLDQDIKNGEKANQQYLQDKEDLKSTLEDINTEITDLQLELDRLKTRRDVELPELIKDNERATAKITTVLETLRVKQAAYTPPDENAISTKVQAINDHNKKVESQEKRERLRKVEKESEKLLDELSDKLRDIEQERIEMLKGKNIIPELEMTEDGVEYQGLPITRDQLSEAQATELWMRVFIAMRPEVRLICIKNGSAFDTEHLKRLREEAETAGYKMLIEKVSDEQQVELELLEHLNNGTDEDK